MSTRHKQAYDFECHAECRTKSKIELQKQYGSVNTTIHGFEYNKPCKFPIRVAGKLFHGCVWSDSVGPWCYTDVERVVTKVYHNGGLLTLDNVHSPVNNKWGICSDNCPIEDCPKCEFPFTYLKKSYKTCQIGGITQSGSRFTSLSWWFLS